MQFLDEDAEAVLEILLVLSSETRKVWHMQVDDGPLQAIGKVTTESGAYIAVGHLLQGGSCHQLMQHSFYYW